MGNKSKQNKRQNNKQNNKVVPLHNNTGENLKANVPRGMKAEDNFVPQDTTKHKVTKPLLEFAQIDYDAVHRETIDIKTCRTNIFVVMLSVIGAIGVALLGMHSNDDFSKWLLPASVVPLLLLKVAILSTIHKARGLNKRLGYLEALSSYIYHDEIPNCWSGWMNAIRVSEKCKCQPEKPGEHPELCQGGKHCNKIAKNQSLDMSKLH